MTRLIALLVAGLALLVLAPLISANDKGQNKAQIKDPDMASALRHLQLAGDSVSPTPSPSATAAPTVDSSTCSNGIIGIESSQGAVCCVVGCGQCGGVGCSTFGLPDYDANDCCVTEILDFGMACSVTGTAPCYID